MVILVLYNPVSGDRKAQSFFEEHVFPLLDKHGRVADKIVSTESPNHAGFVLVNFLEAFPGDVTVILGSGDGTLHEIINILSSASFKGARESVPSSRLHFALVPCGTANALYSSLFPPSDNFDSVSYKLQSIQAFINGAQSIPLTLGIATISASPAQRKQPTVAVSAVVTSTALHAAILRDSESLRHELPGIERFKVAAQNNIDRWYSSAIKLLPAASAGVVQIYDPSKRSFVSHPDSDYNDPIVNIDGPFAYFLSTVNVDRLEPAFRITPLVSSIQSTEPTFDIIILRPFRDPSISIDSPESRSAFVGKSTAILKGAYNDGSHVDMRYNSSGDISTDGDGPPVVEYIRCGGWEWAPDDIDEGAHVLCVDGAIFEIDKGGRVVCSAAAPKDSLGFMVYV